MAAQKLAIQPITYHGTTHALRDWCAILQLEYSTVAMRYRRGVRGDALFEPTPKKPASTSDVPTYATRTEALRSMAPPAYLAILPLPVQKALLEAFGYNAPRTHEYLRSALKEAARIALGSADDASSSPHWFRAHMNLLGFCPDAQVDRVRETFMSRASDATVLADALAQALHTYMPGIVQELTGFGPDGVMDPRGGTMAMPATDRADPAHIKRLVRKAAD